MRNIRRLIAVLWVLVFIFQLPNVLLEDPTDEEESPERKNRTISTFQRVSWEAFEITEMAISYFIPVVVSAVMYTKICMVLWIKNHLIYNSRMDEELLARRNVVKMLILCCAIFFIAYTPMTVLDVSM